MPTTARLLAQRRAARVCPSAGTQPTRTAYDGPAALQAIKSFAPEIVLLDIGMPELDGYEVARRIRSLPGGDDVRIVALTG